MVAEFQRYSLSRFRRLVGFLELLGGVGLAVGYFYSPTITLISSAGLAILMLLGVVIRTKIKDQMVLRIPALILMLLNLFIFLKEAEMIQLN